MVAKAASFLGIPEPEAWKLPLRKIRDAFSFHMIEKNAEEEKQLKIMVALLGGR
jgi:hypothetical protein